MFGYIRPLRGELKVKDFESFKAAYCGLCRSLGKYCGLAARLTVSYDLVFAAMLLSDADRPCRESGRCPLSPIKKRKYHYPDRAFEAAAYYSVILTYEKLKDTIEDESFSKATAARAAAIVLKASYKKARRAAPLFGERVSENLKRLKELERHNCSSLDEPADKFADILMSAVVCIEDEKRRRPLEQIFYHIGRIIYILDAFDDSEEDAVKGRYNPLAYRFGRPNGVLEESDKEELRVILKHSENLIISAFELLDGGIWSEIIQNTIFFGLPVVIDSVLSGTRRKPSRNKI